MPKSNSIKNILQSGRLEFFLEAHNALSARIVEEAGFSGIWASGLTSSASLGLRDCNEASWTQTLDILEFMSDHTSIPILFDGDSGFGNFNNVRRLVKKLEQRQIAGVCLEDKEYPKKNSFIASEGQALISAGEFASKIKAVKDTQIDPHFCVVARTEALITGNDINEALDRCYMYHQAGADAVLIHSKKKTADEIISFTRQWNNLCPVVIVPTTYDKTPISAFEEANISLVLWANHMLRASIEGMKKVAASIFAHKTPIAADNMIAPLEEIFRLQNVSELEEAEHIYYSYAKDIDFLKAQRAA
ncbi:phosphoenolpyruvate mutase [Candidatus Odyssella thessalonicensis]|uniref:phosphoenolpyruvate mutase n=1 Tax=Candidatus Odyssella thessalonicensis TaxID=84647 RepID=UPI000225A9FB|nr:phosphoenolpyruvate mutase [Candidatus Odyssella thessalonicensis]